MPVNSSATSRTMLPWLFSQWLRNWLSRAPESVEVYGWFADVRTRIVPTSCVMSTSRSYCWFIELMTSWMRSLTAVVLPYRR